jgi:FixJ family two-component response regulator
MSTVASQFEEEHAARCARGRTVVIDDDPAVVLALSALLELEGYACETHASAEAYLHVLNYNRPSFPGPYCVVCDMMMPGLNGLELQSRLAALNDAPLLLMSGGSGVREAADGFRAGALDFLVKPIEADALLAAVAKALDVSRVRQAQRHRKEEIALRVASLSERELSVARRVVQGRINVEISHDMGIALRTVKHHRQRAMEKLQVQTVVDLVRIADEAGLLHPLPHSNKGSNPR